LRFASPAEATGRLEAWRLGYLRFFSATLRARAWGRVGKGKSRYLGYFQILGCCFMVPWEQMGFSELSASLRARVTGKGREGEI